MCVCGKFLARKDAGRSRLISTDTVPPGRGLEEFSKRGGMDTFVSFTGYECEEYRSRDHPR